MLLLQFAVFNLFKFVGMQVTSVFLVRVSLILCSKSALVTVFGETMKGP